MDRSGVRAPSALSFVDRHAPLRVHDLRRASSESFRSSRAFGVGGGSVPRPTCDCQRVRLYPRKCTHREQQAHQRRHAVPKGVHAPTERSVLRGRGQGGIALSSTFTSSALKPRRANAMCCESLDRYHVCSAEICARLGRGRAGGVIAHSPAPTDRRREGPRNDSRPLRPSRWPADTSAAATPAAGRRRCPGRARRSRQVHPAAARG
jgi:hypothetical protein